MTKKTVEDITDLAGKSVFLRADFNISLSDGKVANETRILETMPTIEYILGKKAKLIIASHLGRPKSHDSKLSQVPVAQSLEKISKHRVRLIDKFWEQDACEKIADIPADEIVLLENVRFIKSEEENDPSFSRHLASMANYYVNDAFGTSHRVHASIVGVPQHLPAYAGLLMSKEITVLSQALKRPKRPFVVVIGGAKTPEKIAVIEKLLNISDTVALGGAIATTFLAAWGFGMGASRVDYEMVEMARVVFWKAARKHTALILPSDVVISDPNGEKTGSSVYPYNKVPHHTAIFDIGPKTQTHYSKLIKNAKTVLWNGPMGLFENPRYKLGTDSILSAIGASKAFTIVGGGDTITSLRSKKILERIGHISTGGSAMLEFLEKGTLPGIEVLQSK